MSRYIGVQPIDQQVSYRSISEFTASSGQTIFSLNYTAGAVDVYVNGMMELQSAYVAIDGENVVFFDSLDEGDKVVVVSYSPVRQIFNSQTNKVASRDPTSSDALNLGYDVGSNWTNVNTGDTFVCTDNTLGSAVWVNTTKTNNLFI